MTKKTAVIFESFEGKFRTASWEALTCACDFSSGDADEIALVLLDEKPEALAQALARQSGRSVIAVDTGKGGLYHSERTKTILTDLFREKGFTHFCLAGTTQGLDYGPGLAVRLQAECITGVEKVLSEGDRLSFMRSVYGGKIMEKRAVQAPVTIIVTQPGTFKPFSESVSSPGTVDLREDTTPGDTIRHLGIKQVQKTNSALAEASIIVSVGRGVKEEENLALVQGLAAVFTKSAVGGSRPLCDLGWLEYKQQVGITGATVTPDLYLACGISGAAQHISGMRNSGFIVAINIDPKAAIFNYADVCIVEDMTTFIPTFIATAEKLKHN
ncbi:electron transfer flavoprotein subunit alpha/FixB family protein [bacterium]|nr:electron transfer flavoprotein subunit alpha/FixB family protein [bacterium]